MNALNDSTSATPYLMPPLLWRPPFRACPLLHITAAPLGSRCH